MQIYLFKGIKLTYLPRLDNNKLVDLNGLVSSLDNLRWLNVSTNNLQVMKFDFLVRSLHYQFLVVALSIYKLLPVVRLCLHPEEP